MLSCHGQTAKELVDLFLSTLSTVRSVNDNLVRSLVLPSVGSVFGSFYPAHGSVPRPTMNPILEFLKNRNIPNAEQICQEMDLKHVDIKVLPALSEDDYLLSKWMPNRNDRIAVINWSKKRQFDEMTMSGELPYGSVQNPSERPLVIKNSILNNVMKNNEMKTVGIQIGWLHCDLKHGSKKIWEPMGGGVKDVECLSTSKMDDLLRISKVLFFGRDNMSVQGCWEGFDTTIVDFKQYCIGRNTIQDLLDLYGDSGLPIYYLITRYKYDTYSPHTYIPLEDLFSPACTLSTSIILNKNDPLIFPRNATSFDQKKSDDQNKDADGDTAESLNAHYLSLATRNLQTVELPRLNQRRSEFRRYYYGEQGDETSEPQLYSRRINNFKRNKFTFHRGNVFQEMLDLFINTDKQKCEGVFIELIHPNGLPEKGVDTGGVLRDTLSEFWTTMYEICTVGTDIKVPCINHNFKEEQWRAIAKVFYMGWINTQYLPIKLALPIVEQILFGHVPPNMIPPFLLTLGVQDRHVISRALMDFTSVEKDDLITTLNNLECRAIPNANNLKQVIEDIAYKEFVQKPYFVIKQFQIELNSLQNNLPGILTIGKLHALYKSMEPSTENILNMLFCEYNLNPEYEKKIFGYLKKYITDTSAELRLKFLRFCTGADIISGNQIVVKFADPKLHNHYAPTAHTCSCVLLLPLKYQDYDQLKIELNSILTSNCWAMETY